MPELRLGTLNKVLVMGRLTREPEHRKTQSINVLNFGIAVNRRYQNNHGEWKDDTCFINVVAWNQLAERLAPLLKKGSAVLVDGRLQSRSWEAQDGAKRSTIEINAVGVQCLDKREQTQGEYLPPEYPPPPPGDDAPPDDDELPF